MRSRASGAGAFGVWLVVQAAGPLAAQDDRVDPPREPTAAERARMPAELPPEPAPADPYLESFVAWNAGLDAIREDREAQLRLAAARRIAPVDLSFGLE